MPGTDLFRLCEAIPSFKRSQFLEDGDYTGLELELAHHVVKAAAWEYPEELAAMFDVMEELYAQAELTDDTELSNALTVGFFETLLHVSERQGLDFRKLASAISGERTKDGWESALAYEKRDFTWDDEKGLLPTRPLPTPVGTARVHRGRADRVASRFVIELQLLSGKIRPGYLLRSRISSGSYFTGKIAEVHRRSADIPDEFEVRIALSADHEFEGWQRWLELPREEFWQIAIPSKAET